MNNNNLGGDVNDIIKERAQELFEQYRDDFQATDLELEASLEEIRQIDCPVELRKILRNERKITLRALNEAVDALGDILQGKCTKQQKYAYELCVKTRDNLLKTPQEVVK